MMADAAYMQMAALGGPYKAAAGAAYLMNTGRPPPGSAEPTVAAGSTAPTEAAAPPSEAGGPQPAAEGGAGGKNALGLAAQLPVLFKAAKMPKKGTILTSPTELSRVLGSSDVGKTVLG